MTTPDEIQQDIERTRERLGSDVDRLSEKVSPGKVVGRQVDTVRSRANSVKDRFMGSSDDDGGGAREAIGSRASDLKDAAGSAPDKMRSQTRGNPLAVGLIAFGVGWLLSSAAPASQAEQQLAAQAESKAKELAEPLKQAGQEMAPTLQSAVQDSAQQIKETATGAAQETADQARSSAEDVKAPMQQ